MDAWKRTVRQAVRNAELLLGHRRVQGALADRITLVLGFARARENYCTQPEGAATGSYHAAAILHDLSPTAPS
eukprot:3975935-Pleurochrysis_carterae.AAC.1